jgi:hypothetical protein
MRIWRFKLDLTVKTVSWSRGLILLSNLSGFDFVFAFWSLITFYTLLNSLFCIVIPRQFGTLVTVILTISSHKNCYITRMALRVSMKISRNLCLRKFQKTSGGIWQTCHLRNYVYSLNCFWSVFCLHWIRVTETMDRYRTGTILSQCS